MLFGRYTFTCRFVTPAELPAFKGSTLRGLFGVALKRVVCALKHQDCPACALKGSCLYAQVFETDATHAGRPHPFVIEPPATPQTHFKPGQRLSCDLVLMGDVNTRLPYFIYAFEQMGSLGTGKRIDGRRGRFELETVTLDGRQIYARDNPTLNVPDRLPELALAPVSGNGEAQTIQLTLQTPLRLKFKGKLSGGLEFHVLTRALLRRASSVLDAYDGGEPDLDYRGLVQRAQAVQIAHSDLRWFDWRRYSNRQNQGMLMGGMLGSIAYRGALSEFLPLIEFGRQAHIGKNTSFGLGQIDFVQQHLN